MKLATFLVPVVSGIVATGVLLGRSSEARSGVKPTFVVSEGQTIVASAVVTDPPYGADNTGQHDATAPIQQALDAVARLNGGVVFVPPGMYRIGGHLAIGYGTTLMGEWTHPDRGGIGKGTILLACSGRGDEAAPPFITLRPHREASVANVSIWYPEQTPDDIQPYPFTISGGCARVRNVTFYNSYNGIALDIFNGSVLSGIYGTVLNRGIVAPNSTEFSWMYDVHFCKSYWARGTEVLGGRPMPAGGVASVAQFVREHLVGLELGRLDALAIYNFSADDARTPVLIRKNKRVSQHRVHGFGGVVARFPSRRMEHDWDPWYYGMHYANVDNVPEAEGRTYTFAEIPRPMRTDADSFIDVTCPPYSAAGDGKRDDTAAIQRALKRAGELGGGTVYLPQGEYKATQPLVVPRGVELRGPLGAGKVRQAKETCSLAAYCGGDTVSPETGTALVTLMDHAGVRGFNIVYPEQSYDVKELRAFPYSIRGNGKGLWVVDMHLLNSYHGIDLATHRCDEHVVVGLWGTVFHKGIAVGGGSCKGKLERIAFSYGPWAEAGRNRRVKTDAARAEMAEFCRRNSMHYSFGDCSGQSAWGLVGFYPNVHYHFYRDRGRGCVDAEFWLSMHDVAHLANLRVESGENIDLIGYFGTGGRDKTHNWIEVAPEFKGPLNVYAKTIQRTFLNHPYQFTAKQVRFYDEVSLTSGRPVAASATCPGSRPGNAVDRDPRTFWHAPGGSYLEVDLGDVKTIDRFGIESAGLFMDRKLNTAEAELRVSLDGRAFTTVAKIWPGPHAWADRPIDPVNARYVRLLVNRPGEDGSIRIATFSVFGSSMNGAAVRPR